MCLETVPSDDEKQFFFKSCKSNKTNGRTYSSKVFDVFYDENVMKTNLMKIVKQNWNWTKMMNDFFLMISSISLLLSMKVSCHRRIFFCPSVLDFLPNSLVSSESLV